MNRSLKPLLFIFTVLAFVAITLFNSPTPTAALPLSQQSDWCGRTDDPENHGFSYATSQYHWTVNWEKYIAESTVIEVDQVIGPLNTDNIVNAMIVILPREEVADPNACVGFFYMYMHLGNIDGPRADNGASFLLILDQQDGVTTGVELKYALGDLSKLSPTEMQDLKRLAVSTFAETKSVDSTLISVVNQFNTVARDSYEPYYPPATQQPATSTQKTTPTVNHLSFWDMLCLSVLCVVGIIFLFWLLYKLGLFSGTGRSGTSTNWTPTNTTFTPRSGGRANWSSSNSTPRSTPRAPSNRGNGSNNGPRRIG